MWIPYFSESLMISPKADPYQINEENKCKEVFKKS